MQKRSRAAPYEANLRRRTADIVLIELDPAHDRLKIGFGESFHLHERKLWVDETPLLDPTFVPLQNLTLEKNEIAFDAQYRKQPAHIVIAPAYAGIDAIATFLKFLQEHPVAIDPSFSDEIKLLLEQDGFSMTLVNKPKNHRALITYSRKYGNHLIRRYPDPSMRFALESCTLDGGSLAVRCVGPDLYDESAPQTGADYRWDFDLQPEFADAVFGLIRAGIDDARRV